MWTSSAVDMLLTLCKVSMLLGIIHVDNVDKPVD